MAFPRTRMRRLRRTPALRDVVRETRVEPGDLILPVFVSEQLGEDERQPIAALPGISRHGVGSAVAESAAAAAAGVAGVMLFGIPADKDADGCSAWQPDGPVQRTITRAKAELPKLLVTTDVCLCDYTAHGHCGRLSDSGEVDNDATLELLARVAISHARAGADMLFPSDMMDGRVGVLRDALDAAGYQQTVIAAHSVKVASSLYGPFREAAGSAPGFGDRRGYQMDGANRDEAVREALLDASEGADILMVKPALPYLDLIAAVKEETAMPVAAYAVGGEYAMVKHAAAAGALDERAAVLEMLTSIRRAGADVIISYHAKDAAGWLA